MHKLHLDETIIHKINKQLIKQQSENTPMN